MPSTTPRLFLRLALLLATACCPAAVAYAADAPQQYALLVGCTHYENQAIPALDGPVNDVAMWAKLLTEPKGFAFPPANVTRLAGWPDDVKARPTYANIVTAFEALIAKAGPGVQIFILLSGHGTQIPIPESQTDPLDPKNPEPDGMDEVFLPADAKSWGGGEKRVENAIIDDQIGLWLEQLRDKGASVWIVFDCCHAGSMTRDAEERTRTVDPEKALGVPRKAIEDAARRARAAVAKAHSDEATRDAMTAKPSPLDVRPDPKARGKLVAFFACQTFEQAPEVLRPPDAARTPDNYFGLMSYTLIKTLEERRSPLTYRELAQLLLARYKSERGTRGPSPFAEGDLNLEVLGLTVWPDRPDIVLHRDKNQLTVSAGELRGLAPGSILSVHPPPGDARSIKTVLGFLRVDRTTPLTATVTPCDDQGKPPAKAASFEDNCRCAIVSQNLGDLRVKVALLPEKTLRPVFDKLDAKVRAKVELVPEARAEWLFRRVTPKEAKEVYGLAEVDGDRLLLLQNDGRTRTGAAAKQEREFLKDAGKPDLRKVFGGYPVGDTEALVANLERDLQKVFKAQNVWRVSGTLGGNVNLSPDNGLKFEVRLLKDKEDRKGELLRAPTVTAGQTLGFRVENTGPEALWVTALYVSADLQIDVWYTGQIRPGQTLPLSSATVTGDTLGMEGMIVLAVPVGVSKDQPNFDFLEQEPLGKAEAKRRGADDVPKTPFGNLMAAAAFNSGSRAPIKNVPTTPTICSASWITLPSAKTKAP